MKKKLVLVVLLFLTMLFIGCSFGKPKEYNVSYEENGGSLVEDYLAQDGEVIKLPSISKEGYTFLGWYLDSTFTKKVDNEKVNGDITLYAKWEINKYKVKYLDQEIEVEYGKTIDLTSPEKQGYTFIGWYKDAEFKEKWNNEKVTSNITLYPKYEIKKFRVVLDGKTIEAEYGSTLDGEAQEKVGYTFKGWYLDSKLTNKWEGKVESNITLYSKYEKNKYVIKFSGTNLDNIEVEYKGKIEEPKYQKEGYSLDGWYIDSALTTKWNFGKDKVESNITLYPKYIARKYPVTFEEGQTIEVEYDSLVEKPTTPSKTGYTFIGWYKDSSLTQKWDFESDKVKGITKIYIKWEINKYLVTFSEYESLNVKVEYNSLITKPTNPTKSGYSFSGWYLDSTLKTSINFNTYKVSSDVTLYAKWTKNSSGGGSSSGGGTTPTPTPVTKYTVTYNTNGGSSVASESVESGSKLTSKTPTRDEYKFIGWYSDEDLTKEWKFDTNTVTSNITLYAKWEKEETEYTEGLKFKLNSDGKSYSVVGYKGNETDIMIPSKYKGLPVTVVSSESYETGFNNVVSVKLPNSITKIEEYAFSGCETLKNINIPSSVISIGYGAFYDCESLVYNEYDNGLYLGNSENLYFALVDIVNEKITSIKIHNDMKVLTSSVFHNCEKLKYNVYKDCNYLGSSENPHMILMGTNNDNLEKVDIHKDVKIIEFYAFSENDNITSVILPEGLVSIGYGAFFGCALTEIVIPSTVNYIDFGAFVSPTIKTIKVNENNKYYCSVDDNLYSKDKKTIIQYAIGKTNTSFIIPNEVENIGGAAFYGCESLESISLSNNLVSIGESAFLYCTKLKSIEIPNSVESIGEYAFSECESLESVSLSNNLASIGAGVFSWCAKLKSIEIPNSVESIGKYAFYYCESLETIIINNPNITFDDSAFKKCNAIKFNEYENGLYLGTDKTPYLILAKVKDINVDAIKIHKDTIAIFNSAFDDYYNITSIDIDEDNLFYKSIYNCLYTKDGKTLIKVVSSEDQILKLPSTLTSINNNAFSNVKFLSIYYDGTLVDWCNIKFNDEEENPMNYASDLYIKNGESYSKLTEIVLPNTITSINPYQFYRFNDVVKITIPTSVTYIDYTAFDYSDIDDIYYDGTLNDWLKITIINGNTWHNHFRHLYLKDSEGYKELTEVVIPDGVTVIGNYQFIELGYITSITIPNSVESIGYNAFEECRGLTNVNFKGTFEKWSKIKFVSLYSNPIYYSNHLKVLENDELKEVEKIVIPSGTTKIGDYVFAGFSNVINVTIPSSVESISYDAFAYCKKLDNVYYDGTLTDWCNIEFSNSRANPMYYANSFYMKDSNGEYKEVTEIVIPNTVTKIGSCQFYGFNNVTSITIPNSVESIGSYALSGCKLLINIIIPSSVIDLSYDVFEYCELLTIYCETSSKPSGWHNNWNRWYNNEANRYEFYTVIWNYNTGKFTISFEENGGEEVYDIKVNGDDNIILPKPYKKNYRFIGWYKDSELNSLWNSESDVVSANITLYAKWEFAGTSGLKYELNTDGKSYKITDYIGNETDVIIPSTYDGLPVTSIGSYAFYNCSSLTSITIPNSVESINQYAFSNCTSLVYNEYDNGLYLGNSDNPYLVLVKVKNVTSIIINKNTKLILNNAFNNSQNMLIIYCEMESKPSTWNNDWNKNLVAYFGIKEVIEQEGIQYLTIDNEAIITRYVGSSNKVVIPSKITANDAEYNVTTINPFAFYGCTLLTSITIPNSVNSIGSYAFADCYSLTIYCEVVEQPSEWDSTWNKSDRPVYYSVKEIIEQDGIQYLIIDDVAMITRYVGSDKKVVIPSTIKVNEVTYNVTTIATYAFSYSEVASVFIPNSIKKIDSYAFYGCKFLTIYCEMEGKPSEWNSKWNNNSRPVYYEVKDVIEQNDIQYLIIDGVAVVTRYIGSEKDVEIPSKIAVNDVEYNVTTIATYAFSYSEITSIIVANSVTSIAEYAFDNCRSLDKVYYEGTLTDWCNIKFSGISSNPMSYANSFFMKDSSGEYKEVTEIIIPESVTSIGEYQFYGFNNVKSIVIPNTVESIGNSAFHECSSLEYNEYENGYYLGNGENKYLVLAEIKNTRVTSFNINKNTKFICSYVFYDCRSLDKVYYEGTLTDWCNIKFSGISSNPMSYANSFFMKDSSGEYKEVTEIVIPESVTSIGEYQFYGFSNVTSITIPNSVESIGFNAFGKCEKLEKLTLPFVGEKINGITNTHFGYIFGSTRYSMTGAISGASSYSYVPNSLKEVILTNCKVLDTNAFYCCKSLKNIVIFKGATSINSNAFYGCDTLTIYCVESLQPSNWSNNWNSARPVYYGVQDVIEQNGIQYLIINGNAVVTRYVGSETNVEIPSTIKVNEVTYNVTTIGESAFSCSEVVNVLIKNSVDSIGAYAFSGCNSLTNITIPNSITKIDEGAFNGCTSLTNIVIPSRVNYIGSYAFSDCESLTIYCETSIKPNNWDDAWNSDWNNLIRPTYYGVQDVIEQEGIQYLIVDGNAVLTRYVGSNENVEVPSTITYNNNTYNVKTIGDKAFNNNKKLINVKIPNSIEYFGNNVFYKCENLEYNEYENGYYLGNSSNPYLVIIKSKNKNITKIKLNENTKFIYSSAFSSLSSLESITISNSIISIGSRAFFWCKSLDKVYYEGTLTDWCNIKFSGISSNPMSYANSFFMKDSSGEYKEVTEIIIPESVTSIGEYQFYGFNNVKSIVIPNTVESIGFNAFGKCEKLEKLTLPFVGEKINGITNTHFGYIFGSSAYSNNGSYVPNSLKEVILTSGTSICDFAFYECELLESIIIPNGVKSIGENAFYGCTSLINVDIPDSVETVGCNAFFWCSSLTNIKIPNKIKEIASYTFYYCRSLTSIEIPNGCESIDLYAFCGCEKLESIIIPTSVKSIGSSAFCRCQALKNISIPSGVTCIKKSTFDGCEKLESIIIPSSVERIEEYAFDGCEKLVSITLFNSVKYIEEYVFSGCRSLTIYCEAEEKPSGWSNKWNGDCTNIIWNAEIATEGLEYELNSDESGYIVSSYNGEMDKVVIPSVYNNLPVIGIKERAFFNKKIIGITFSSSIKAIGKDAFEGCSSLNKVNYKGTIEDWCQIVFESINSNPINLSQSLYLKNENDYTEVTEIIIPDSVTKIGAYQFYNFGKITNVQLNNSITEIGNYAFAFCISLTKINIPESVTKIGTCAFACCHSLTKISVDNENEYYSSLDGSLYNKDQTVLIQYAIGKTNETFIIPTKVEKISESAFSQSKYLVVIDSFNDVKEIGYGAFMNCPALEYVKLGENVEEIGELAFYFCPLLEKVVITSSVTNIKNGAFAYCIALNLFEVSTDNQNYKTIDGSLYSKDGKTLVQYALGKSDTQFIVSDTVEVIESLSFAEALNLEEVVIPSSVDSIGLGAFSQCLRLKSISVFLDNPNYKTIDGCLYSKDGKTLIQYALGKTDTQFIVSDTVETIGNSAFLCSSNLTKVVLSNSVHTIEAGAFERCLLLKEITIPSSVESIGEGAFLNCPSLTINCEATSQQENWNRDWNISNCPIVWGYKSN